MNTMRVFSLFSDPEDDLKCTQLEVGGYKQTNTRGNGLKLKLVHYYVVEYSIPGRTFNFQVGGSWTLKSRDRLLPKIDVGVEIEGSGSKEAS